MEYPLEFIELQKTYGIIKEEIIDLNTEEKLFIVMSTMCNRETFGIIFYYMVIHRYNIIHGERAAFVSQPSDKNNNFTVQISEEASNKIMKIQNDYHQKQIQKDMEERKENEYGVILNKQVRKRENYIKNRDKILENKKERTIKVGKTHCDLCNVDVDRMVIHNKSKRHKARIENRAPANPSSINENIRTRCNTCGVDVIWMASHIKSKSHKKKARPIENEQIEQENIIVI